jgi:hypothetical protein
MSPTAEIPRSAGFRMCRVCQQAFPARGYSLHKMQPWHIEHLAASVAKADAAARLKTHKERRELAVSSRMAGMSMGDIGTMLGVSRQRIHQMLVTEGKHIPRDPSRKTWTCFIDGQEFQVWREHSEGVAHKTAEDVIVGHIKTSPYPRSRWSKE